MKQAMFYENISEQTVKCYLCPHGCVLKPEQVGICMARKNYEGALYSLNYGKITSLALDPIEKKPLRNFNPGRVILSAGSFGCNLKCSFCQNWQISQQEPESDYLDPADLVEIAVESRNKGNIGIAYTYNEPSIWYEYVYDCAKLTHKQELKNVMVTNGYIRQEPLEKLLPYIDAMNIDLKSITNKFYNDICKGEIDYVKETIKLCSKQCHVEVTSLIIPEHNDSEKEIEELSSWLASVSAEIPLHLTAYYPNYKMQQPQQMSRKRLSELAVAARQNLKYVYS